MTIRIVERTPWRACPDELEIGELGIDEALVPPR
jgi:hypothetical protein